MAGLSIEKKFRTQTFLGLSVGLLNSEANRQRGVYVLDTSGVFTAVPAQALEALDYRERSLAVTLDQLVGKEWSFGAHYRVTKSALDQQIVGVTGLSPTPAGFLQSTETEAILHQGNLFAIYNHPSGFFAQAQALWFMQNNQGNTPKLPGDNFWQFNLLAGYRFWHRKAEATIGLLNLADQDYRLNPLNTTMQLPRDRTLTASFRFSF